MWTYVHREFFYHIWAVYQCVFRSFQSDTKIGDIAPLLKQLRMLFFYWIDYYSGGWGGGIIPKRALNGIMD